MKRIARRTLAVTLGLILGWYFAGFAPSFMPGLGVSMAQETSHAHAAATTQPSSESGEGEGHAATDVHESHATAAHAGHTEGSHGAHEEHGPNLTEQLVPQAHDVTWYHCVLMAAAGLFAAAVVLGSVALKIRGPLPPDPADTHDDHGHDAHGKDDHGHASGGGHH